MQFSSECRRTAKSRSTTRDGIPLSACTRRPDEIGADGFSSSRLAGTNSGEAAASGGGGGFVRGGKGAATSRDTASRGPTTIVAPESQFRTCPTDHGITDSACKNQLVVVSVQYGPFNPYIPIRSTTIGKSRVAIDPIAMRTSWRSNSDIANVTSIGYPHMSASGESSTTMHRLLHASGSHPIPPPYDPNECKTSSFRLVGTTPFWPSASERSADVRGSVECGAGLMRCRFVGADVLGKVCLLLPIDVNAIQRSCS
ncbi:putative ribosome-binding factor A, chloroplastic [Dorcoceras hygrometricum]|uniref:Putative ribosome-binding factor A, chloroplastic n=1 Tax=Dorcoceras hygrometricum TaxID=472368 RepID=A0A2Z7AT05_9LAMI|nr:putative ribosome-binding factor A, chloroplastic [Dorcoceras hygrometricum]